MNVSVVITGNSTQSFTREDSVSEEKQTYKNYTLWTIEEILGGAKRNMGRSPPLAGYVSGDAMTASG